MRRSAKKELALFFEFVKRKNVLHNKIPILVFLSLTFLLALAIRIHNLDVPGIAIDREYRSALIARAYYFDGTDSIAEWRHEVISASKKRAGVLEPPITEILASIIYRFADDEQLWMARLLTSIFWLIGGIFLFIIAARIESYEAGLVSTAYYLLVPVGVLYSRTFIPDSLMIMAFLFSLFLIVQHHDQPTERRLIQAASISGLSILIKPLIIFALLGAYTALAITRKANNSIGKELLIFGTVCLFPALTYYGYGIISGTALGNQFHGTFLPQLLLSVEYWRQWLLSASGCVGVFSLVAGMVGLSMQSKGTPRALLIGLWLGYVIFGMVFTNHIRFAEYYHLQLVVVVALSFGPIITLITNKLRQSIDRWLWWIPVFMAIMLIVTLNVRNIRGQLAGHPLLGFVGTYRGVGEIVHHNIRTVYIARYYGKPLEYYGELSGSYWPRKVIDRDRALRVMNERSVDERLRALNYSPEYFIITNLQEYYTYHLDLKEYIEGNCSLFAGSNEYLIYNNCTE